MLILFRKNPLDFITLFEFKAEGEIIKDYEVAFKRDERIMRFLTVKLDKHAIAYNEKKRRMTKEKEKADA